MRKVSLSLKRNCVHERPISKKTIPRIRENRLVFIFQKGDLLCVVRREGRAAMSGLWEFPYIEYPESVSLVLEELEVDFVMPLESVMHSYTKYVVTLFPYILRVPFDFSWNEGVWLTKEQLLTRPFSAGHKRVLEQFYGAS